MKRDGKVYDDVATEPRRINRQCQRKKGRWRRNRKAKEKLQEQEGDVECRAESVNDKRDKTQDGGKAAAHTPVMSVFHYAGRRV